MAGKGAYMQTRGAVRRQALCQPGAMDYVEAYVRGRDNIHAAMKNIHGVCGWKALCRSDNVSRSGFCLRGGGVEAIFLKWVNISKYYYKCLVTG